MKDERNTVVDAVEETAEMDECYAPVDTGVVRDAANALSHLRSAAVLQAAKALNNPENAIAKTMIGKGIRSIVDISARMEFARLTCNFVTSLAEKIDRLLAYGNAVAEEIEEEEIAAEPVVEEIVDEAPVAEEPVVEAFAAIDAVESNDEEDDDDDEDKLPAGLSSLKLDYIDVMEDPEKYQEMLAQEARGEVQLVTRYRRSFLSRLIQSQGNVQDYYNEIKNLLLSYKGVKGRISWGNESFNRGRSYVAKVVAKTKTLYVYLAIDPKTLEDSTYEVVDVSDKKKYAAVPTLIKVRGDRKFKFVMDLIRRIAEEDMALPPVKNFEAVDYHIPYAKTEELVLEKLVKKFVAAIPAER